MMVVEGLRLVREALKSSIPVDEVFVTEDFAHSDTGKALIEVVEPHATSLCSVSPAVMQALSETETPQGVLAVMPVPGLRCTDDLPLTLIPDSVRDPGNLGTILRAAWASGVSQVLLPPGTVDYLNCS